MNLRDLIWQLPLLFVNNYPTPEYMLTTEQRRLQYFQENNKLMLGRLLVYRYCLVKQITRGSFEKLPILFITKNPVKWKYGDED